MSERETFETTTEAAEAVFNKYQRLATAIEAEVTNLTPAIADMQAASKEFQNTEIQVTLGEANSAALAKAKKRLDDTRTSFDGVTRRLDGLRSRAMDVVIGEFPKHRESLKAGIPEYNERVKDAFREEWNRAVAAFAETLGTRRELERLLGEPMNLAEPQPGPGEISGDAFRPHRAVEAIEGVIARMASEARDGRLCGVQPQQTIGPHDIYVLTHKTRDIEAGTLVVEATFPAGVLANLVAIDWARPLREKTHRDQLRAVERIKRRFDASEEERLNAEREREAAEQKERRRKLGVEYDGPTGGAAIPRSAGSSYISNLQNGPSPNWPSSDGLK